MNMTIEEAISQLEDLRRESEGQLESLDLRDLRAYGGVRERDIAALTMAIEALKAEEGGTE